MRFDVDPDIRRARTLPAEAYGEEAFGALTERVLARAWSWVGDEDDVATPGSVCPVETLPPPRPEPLVLVRDGAGVVRCLSNVCTHRGNLVVAGRGTATALRCGYHGRRFGLDGAFLSMPRMEGAEGFPAPEDALPRVPLGRLGRLLFASLRPAVPFDDWLAPVRPLLEALRVDEGTPDPSASRDYDVAAHWALYVDNYLEGFHVPFVHPGLTAALEPSGYDVETLPHAVVQRATARPGEPALDLPGPRRLAAVYVWLFPTTMLNVYPWGLSLNVVRPLAHDRTRVTFRSYVRDERLRSTGAGADLDRVEAEDESVVESVQRGLRSRLAARGRYSPLEEAGVHHFHRLLAQAVE